MKVALIRRRLYQQGLSVDPDNVRILMSLASMHRQLSDNEVRLELMVEDLRSVIIECDTNVTFLDPTSLHLIDEDCCMHTSE